MPLLQFLPWCHLLEETRVGDVTLIPFKRDSAIDGLDALHTAWARQILAPYKSLSGLPVYDAALLRYGTKGLFDDLTEEERTRSYECVELLAFCALANRQFFSQGSRYCNFDNFRMFGHGFRDDPARATLVERRADGNSWNSVALSELVFSQPPHTNSTFESDFDTLLLDALAAHQSGASEWSRWQNAIISFNRANTDDSSMLYQVEWTLLCSAFEHLLGAASNASDVARILVDHLIPEIQIPAVLSRRKKDSWREQSLRYQWLKDFYASVATSHMVA